MFKLPKKVGDWLIWATTLLLTPWSVVMTTVLGTAGLFWATSVKWLESPDVHAVAFTFLAILWTLIGLTVLADRNKTRSVAVQKDLSYGIIIESVTANYLPFADEPTLNFAVQIRNFTQSALRYEFVKFEVLISTRITRVPRGVLSGLLQRGGAKVVTNDSFKSDDLKDFVGKDMKGIFDLSVAYGPPDEPLTRIFHISHAIGLNFVQVPLCVFTTNITSELDQPYSKSLDVF